ncbi:hypothetical protein LCGC14_1429610 [marine sediment metagenome]|uniref:SHOCT domain-containing protein n=1 Tax=marine sediment metagenome TaxID=412755 RepID=A0A0F9JP00_9ZZZZ
MGFLSDWFNWSNALYLIILILGVVFTLVTTKYRAVIAELKELMEVVRKGYADGTLDKKEKEAILKEVLDVLKAILGVIWKPVFKVKK